MIPSTDLFRELSEHPALAPRVADFGVVFVDLDEDQPPYVGLMLELDYRPDLRVSQRQMFKLNLSDLRALVDQLDVIQKNERDLREGP